MKKEDQVLIKKRNYSKTVAKENLGEYLKNGWGEVIIGKRITKKVEDYTLKGTKQVDMEFDPVTVKYSDSGATSQKDSEIESLKKQVADLKSGKVPKQVAKAKGDNEK